MKVLIISNDSALHRQLAALCAARTPPLTLVAMRDGLQDATERLVNDTPQLVILDACDVGAGEAEMLERLTAQYPQASFMLLTTNQSQDMLLRAMRAGVREVLPLPLVTDAFNAALARFAQINGPASSRDGKVLALISCKGGSGATFLAANLGYALATVGQKKVLLIDLNQQFGDAALYVSDKKPVMTLADVCVQIARIDAPFLEASLLPVAPNFGVLAASEDAASANHVKPEHIDTILRLARHSYDFIVLDIGRQIDAISIRALDNADLIYPVLQLALPDIRDGRRLLDIFRSLGYRRDNIRLIVNRYEKGGKLHLVDLESTLGADVVHTIPNDYVAVTDSVNQGVPLLQQSQNSAAAKSLVLLVDQIVERPAGDDSRVLSRLLGKIFS